LLKSHKHYACILMNGLYIICKSNIFVFSPSHSPKSFYFQGFWKSYLDFWHELHNLGSILLQKNKSINTHLNFPNSFHFHFCHLQHLFFIVVFLPSPIAFFSKLKGPQHLLLHIICLQNVCLVFPFLPRHLSFIFHQTCISFFWGTS
jgi:hypothetical protein